MIKTIVTYVTITLILSFTIGCSQTWEGVKSDSGDAWKSTKGTIHKATK